MKAFDPERFEGTWVSSLPFDSDDYLVEYTIEYKKGLMRVKARDYRDGEILKISKVRLVGEVLEFESLMPSTGRKGVNRLRLKRDGELHSEFTFTVVETLKRIH